MRLNCSKDNNRNPWQFLVEPVVVEVVEKAAAASMTSQ